MKHLISFLTLAALSLGVTAQTAQEPFVRRSVVEEFTGTWCGHCPRGIVGMERLSEDFGDRFIGIAIHTGSGEPMVIPAYPDLQSDLLPGSGAPSCVIDRVRFKFDPYSGSGRRGALHYGIDLDFADALAMPTEAKVELEAEWADEYQWDVRFTATTTFNIDSQTAPYRLIFVLVEDSLCGTTDAWRQTNYFSLAYDSNVGINFQDDDMRPWRDAPYHVEGVVYNHVPVNTLGVRSGIQGSIQAPIVAWQPQTYSNTITTLASHASKLIQDKSRLRAVCMLINTSTGEVVNAAKCPVLAYGASGITHVPASSPAAASYYDLQGRRLTSATARGLYVDHSSGRTYLAK